MPSRENLPVRETNNRKMLGFRGALREDEVRAQGRKRDLRRANPTGADRDLGTG